MEPKKLLEAVLGSVTMSFVIYLEDISLNLIIVIPILDLGVLRIYKIMKKLN